MDTENTKQEEAQSLRDDMRNMLEEARMILPGIQALIGFQTMAVFNTRFEQLPVAIKQAYLVALGLLILAMGLLMTPAAYHRLAERGKVSRKMIDLSSKFITTGMVPLMLAFAIDAYVVTMAAIENSTVATIGAICTIIILGGLWFLFPLTRKRNR